MGCLTFERVFFAVNEAALVQQAQCGNADAFAELVHTHERFVYNLALRMVGNQPEAEDLAQEAFVRAWMALPNFRGQAQFRTWLYRIATNLCYNRLPGLRREIAEVGDDCLEDALCDEVLHIGPAEHLEGEEERAYLQQAIEGLPESYRLLVTLRYQQDLPYEEIAQVVNLPLGTVKTGLFRAKQQLREALRSYQEESVWTH